MDVLRITTSRDAVDVGMVHRFLSERSTWAKGIPLAVVQRAVDNSLNFSGYLGNAQVAYARVVSDYATFAYLADVFVLEEYRGRGYSRLLMEQVMAHPDLQRLRRFMLATSSAHGVYAPFGFAAPWKPETLMERLDPDVYSRGQ